MNTASFSVDGRAAWSAGMETAIEILDKNQGSIRFKAHDLWHDSISNITSQKFGNVYCDSYAQAFQEALDQSEHLGTLLEGLKGKSPSLDNYKASTTLSKQLYQVARIIATRGERKAERDFFFVQLGGWDTHSGIKDILPEKLKEVDDSIAGFVAEMKTQKVFDSVVLATESDFGRTLSFNGAGTDHGWGGNHIIVGGDINGREVYNDFLETYVGDSDYDAGRGRVIPKYPWESMMVPIAEWMGVDEVDAIFPNLGNFNRSQHIIPRKTLFKS